MLTFQEFRSRLKQAGIPVFRDMAPDNTPYPYFVYTYTHERRLIASNKDKAYLAEYQVSLFTLGTESDLKKFRELFNGVPYQAFRGVPGDEDDQTVTNLYTYIEVAEDA